MCRFSCSCVIHRDPRQDWRSKAKTGNGSQREMMHDNAVINDRRVCQTSNRNQSGALRLSLFFGFLIVVFF